MVSQIFTVFLSSVVILSSLAEENYAGEWGYIADDKGSAYWSEISKTMCSGLAQSPINIKSDDAVFIGKIDPQVVLTSTATHADKIVLLNNGHTVMLTPNQEKWTASLTSSESSSAYTVAQVHFHWGSDDSKGSEHHIDDKIYPLEMHIVTYDSGMYNDFATAAGKPKGLAVIGVFFRKALAVSDNVGLNAFGSLLSKIGDVVTPKASVEMDYFDPKVLLPRNRTAFYRYLGSLTTPECTENVQWTVMRDAIPVTSKQLKVFRQLNFGDPDKPHKMQNNYRSIQPLNPNGVLQRRMVFRSWKIEDDDQSDSALNMHASSFLLTMLIFISILLSH